MAYEGGATLGGVVRAPLPAADLGEVRWQQVDGAAARLTTPTGAWTLVRDRFGSVAPPDGRTGTWWSDDLAGVGFLLEQQASQLRLGVHAFADNGRATWAEVLFSRGVDGVYRGRWQQPSEALPHTLVPVAGTDSEWVWLSALEGRLRLPNGRHISLKAGVSGDLAEARSQSAALLGIWQASYMLGGYFSERWTLAHLRPSEMNVGDFNVWGVNQWGGTLVGGWSTRYANHSLYAPGLAFDDFYRFQWDDGVLKGCYHHYHIASATLSACYPFTASSTDSAQAALAAWPTLTVGMAGDRNKEARLQATLVARMAASDTNHGVGAVAVKSSSDEALSQLQAWRQQLGGRP